MIDELKQNRIDKLRGLDKLTDLNCLSIGNNQITDLLASLQVSVGRKDVFAYRAVAHEAAVP